MLWAVLQQVRNNTVIPSDFQAIHTVSTSTDNVEGASKSAPYLAEVPVPLVCEAAQDGDDATSVAVLFPDAGVEPPAEF